MRSSSGQTLRSASSLCLTLAAAWLLDWEARDLMWGAWASSLTFGWTYGLVLFLANPEEVDAGPGWREGASGVQRLLALFGVFSLHFLLFHYAQGIFLAALFPPSPDTSQFPGIFLYPSLVFSLYWPVVAATFLAGLGELREAAHPSEDTERLLRPYANIARIQVLLFLFLFMSGLGLMGFAAYPFLVLYFFPIPSLGQKIGSLWERLDTYMNTPR